MYGEILSRISNAPNSEVPLFQRPRFQRLHCTTLCAYYPPRIEPKLCTYTLPNFSNFVYQFTLPQRVTILCIYFPPPIEPKVCNYTLPNFINIVYQSTPRQRGTTLCIYFPPPIEPKLCNYTLPNFINIVYQSTLRQLDSILCTYFHPPIEPKLYNFTLPGMYIIVGWKNYHSTGDRCLHYFQQNCNTFLTLVTTGFELYLFPIYLQFSLVSW